MPPLLKKIDHKTGAHEEKENKCWYKNLDIPAEVALYYGFTPINPPVVNRDDLKKARQITDPELRGKKESDLPFRFSLEEKVALLRYYNEKKMESLPQPVMLYLGKSMDGEVKTPKGGDKERSVLLEILGTNKSIAEALLIKTSLEILKEESYSDLSIHLNSIGDRDTVSRFAKELTAYYRKNLNNIPAHCRQLFKKDVFDLLSCKNEKCRIMKESAPKSINFLSEPSRIHFTEVLEYLEILKIPYEIDHFLVANKSFSFQTLFEIYTPERNELCRPLAVGVRYLNIAKKLGYKRDLPGIGVKLMFEEKDERKNLRFFKPKIYFIQLGIEAKLKSLQLIETLRQAKIPTYQAISRDRLVSQLGLAESMRIPYIIIMGQKEALEESVIVRDMGSRSQETVKICDLPKYLKKL